MLVSHQYKFIVGLPTKCGTNSMRNMAISYGRHKYGSKEVLQELPQLRHRMDVPEGCEGYARAMVVRNPFSRLVSMYEYLRRHNWEWKYKDIMDAEERLGRRKAWTWFLHMMLDEKELADGKDYWRRKVHGKRPYIWTDSLASMGRFLGGSEPGVQFPWSQSSVRLLRLERLASDWDQFARECGWQGYVPQPAVNNATRGESKLHDVVKAYFAASHDRQAGIMVVGEDRDLGQP